MGLNSGIEEVLGKWLFTVGHWFVTFQFMRIGQNTLDEFKRIYKKEFEEEMDDKEAYDRFTRLINVMKILTSKNIDTDPVSRIHS